MPARKQRANRRDAAWRGSVRTAVVLLGIVALGGCTPAPESPHLEIPADLSAVEARFGEASCRRLEDPQTLADLAAFARSHRGGWEPSWTEAAPAQLTLRFEGASGEETTLGVGAGQLLATLDGRAFFQPLSEAARRDLVERIGGPPMGAPEIPCRRAD
ncbi:MAG TPA: hypothetical protein VMT85_01510 [Thermoanaerobaculia bacterium]|nr:hypothetical protein [Thermoanaerobaculia bacterium]